MTFVLGLLILLSPTNPLACGSHLAPSQPADVDWFWAINEIPEGSITKYEVEVETGRVVADRFMSMPVAYPGNYGFIPGSMAGDGGPLDVLILTREPLVPGALMAVRAIGVLPMLDGGEQDDKVIAVPTTRVDPHFADVLEMEDLPAAELDRIEAFFNVYKLLPEGRKEVELQGRGTSAEARRSVREAIAACG